MDRKPPHPEIIYGLPRPNAPTAEVEYTISEDRAAGDAAHAEAGFARLAAASLAVSSQTDLSNHALMDYQMQLMQLENQNKERLRFAREEQDMIQGSQDGVVIGSQGRRKQRPAPSGMVPGQMLPPLVLQQQRQIAQPLAMLAQATQQQLDGNMDAANVSMDLGDFEADIQAGDEIQPEAVTEPQDPSKPALDADAVAHDINQHHVVLYRIVCATRRRYCHGRISQSPPCSQYIEGQLHLVHPDPVENLPAFLSARQHPTAFIVYHEVRCDITADASSHGAFPPPSDLPCPRELVAVVSGELHVALQKISKFPHDHRAYMSSPALHRDSANLTSTSPSEYTLYFLYHHRDVLCETSMLDSFSDSAKALREYVQNGPHSVYYRALDELFNRGQASAESLEWLYESNEVLLCKEGSLEVAYTLRSPPVVGTSGSVELDCWSWGYDGTALRRKDKTIKLTVPTYGTVPIVELSAYPLRYADKATRKRLLERGRRFWELRNQIHVSYEGPDYKGERVYVSLYSLIVITGRDRHPLISDP
jgi:hypothetical protein